ncbi:hypothetical protein LTR35_017943 [Friedmanniomyces endolithicus]|uniref:Dynamin stalk domain-containing protein n=1 Tax=Friedmanniomyces endolithicus TaxID=329885 RepID=A0AAN6F417_9PEZI|nr:hypothetical protein LTR35_017943 [Friedmanniomyces endolithicus]KAK0269295.1 hypothetical protein LTS00_017339 [Friedmanniomyces endolithicus]KAK0303551.1 hypothetical protein LTR82_017515 [Friedmanniomyces endolithicus]KAK0972576.1 hypothetical protein LTR54_017542 [Friedmanniomyces endolithicus]
MKALSATTIPHPSRHETLKASLQGFQLTINGFKELPEVIVKAGVLMGLRGYGDNRERPSFAEDVRRIKVTGPCGLQLSIVDSSGLKSNVSEEQTEDDVETVHRMVDSYVEKPRTVILAVVRAGNDIANESIIPKSKLFDKAGQCTVGFTRPDVVNAGTNELRYFQSPVWKEQKLDATRGGIDKLQTSLKALINRHIEKELPEVREQIKSTIRTSEQEIR